VNTLIYKIQEEPKTPIKKSSSPSVQPKKEIPAKKTEVKPPPPPLQSSKKAPAIADKKVDNTKKTTPAAAKPAPPRARVSEQLLQELEESIAKIQQKRDKLDRKKQEDPPHLIGPLQIDSSVPVPTNVTEEESSTQYQQMLIDCLRESLNLPEYGEVKIRLTLKKDGSVQDLTVLKAESEKNKRYLEEKLPFLRFPRLRDSFSNKNQSTFVLTFCNEI